MDGRDVSNSYFDMQLSSFFTSLDEVVDRRWTSCRDRLSSPRVR
jgi:hypothetical protein